MTTGLVERSNFGKISRNRLVLQSGAIGNVARREGLPEYVACSRASDEATPAQASDSGLAPDGFSEHYPVGLRLSEG